MNTFRFLILCEMNVFETKNIKFHNIYCIYPNGKFLLMKYMYQYCSLLLWIISVYSVDNDL